MNRNVWLDKIDDYNVKEIQSRLEHCFFDLDIKKLFKPKMRVLIKVCMPVSVSRDNAETTHPAVVSALVNVLSELGVKCIIADSPYKKYAIDSLDNVYLNTGMLEVANISKCELNRNLKTCKVNLPEGRATKTVNLLEVVNDVDAIINVGKIKLDNQLGYIGAVANLFGLIPGEKKTLALNGLLTQKDFNNYLLDVYSALQDKLILNVLDGIVALENDCTPRMLYCLAVSENIFALDKAVLDILSVDENETIIKTAKDREIIRNDFSIKVVNESVEDFKLEDFALPEINLSKKIHKNESERASYYNRNQAVPVIKEKKCKGCSICSKICPTNAISMKYDENGELFAKIDYDKCIFCNKCITACPYLVAKLYTPSGYKDLEKEINKFNKE